MEEDSSEEETDNDRRDKIIKDMFNKQVDNTVEFRYPSLNPLHYCRTLALTRTLILTPSWTWP